MARNDRVTLQLMLDAAQSLSRTAARHTRETFASDETVQLAMLHLIQRLGEEASRVSADFRAAHPEFPWPEMVGMRNRIVHGYEELNLDIVWRVASKDIETVIAALERALVV